MTPPPHPTPSTCPGAQWILNRWENGKWPWSWTPRTCSHCGGIHPEDAIRLISEGWEVEPTDKSYKRYLHPPGSSDRLVTVFHNLETKGTIEPAPSVIQPAPHVKLYTYHFSETQAARFNTELKRAEMRDQRGPG